MTRPPAANFTVAGQTFDLVGDDQEHFDSEDLQFLQAALDDHDHSAGRGRAVGRVGPNTVGAANLADGALGGAKLAAAAVTADKIAAAAATLNGLATGAVAAAIERDGGLTALSYAPRSITGPKIILQTITADLFAPNLLPPPTIEDGSITHFHIRDGAVTPEKLAAGTYNPARFGPVSRARYVLTSGYTHQGPNLPISLNDGAWAVDGSIGDGSGVWNGPADPTRFGSRVEGLWAVFGFVTVAELSDDYTNVCSLIVTRDPPLQAPALGVQVARSLRPRATALGFHAIVRLDRSATLTFEIHDEAGDDTDLVGASLSFLRLGS